jgi:glutamate--cysteine ligase
MLKFLKQNAHLLKHIRRGVEKESLRITPCGSLKQDAHPKALGSALTHPHYTTDFSENLLEMVTAPHEGFDALNTELTQLHAYFYSESNNQWLWPLSMPMQVDDVSDIQIAQYGSSNGGKMKMVYREGLTHRYGKMMQIIAGIHFNLSFPESFFKAWQADQNDTRSLQDFTSDAYMRLSRNSFRYDFLLPYLFGASPICTASSVSNDVPGYLTQKYDAYVGEYATSLRMSDLGYQNNAQENLHIDYNSVEGYAHTLLEATATPHKDFAHIAYGPDQFDQLSDKILQIENEYYSAIRPKQPIGFAERPAHALLMRGVSYTEVRVLDLDPFDSNGISTQTMHFMDVFLLWCMLKDSPKFDEHTDCRGNFMKVATRGRDPELTLYCKGEQLLFAKCAHRVLGHILEIAEVLDEALGGDGYAKAVKAQQAKVDNAALTPSAKLLTLFDEHKDYVKLGLHVAKAILPQGELSEPELKAFQDSAVTSLAKQSELEAQPQEPFSEYVKRYFMKI